MVSHKRKFVAVSKDSKREFVLARGCLNGTVASGFPCTTLCNSIRSLSYMLTIIKLAGIQYDLSTNTGDIVIYLAGDDQLFNVKP